jgi:hypothetical protein
MTHTNNLLKVLSSVIVKHDNNNLNILFNVLSYLILKKMVGNTFSLQLYNSIYDSALHTSFISVMKSKYSVEVIKLDPCEIEKIINHDHNINHNNDHNINLNNNHMICIYDIITTLNLKNLQYNQNNFNYINHTIDIIKSSINHKSSMLLLSSNFGEFNNILNMSNSIEVFDICKENTILSQMEYDYNHHNIDPKGHINSKIIFKCEDYIHNNIINKSYDIIMCNFPTGLRNIIHADCCDKIKRLKIRGTKSEPLILQLIMMSLNINGKASLLVPNTLLNNDSKQHVETRNYLINNFNVTDIITCDNNLSILYFEKTGLSKKITFSKIQDNKIVKLFDVFYDKIVKRNYNLYYEKYINIDCNMISTICNNNKKTLHDIVDIVECMNNISSNISSNYLRIPKFLSNDTQKVEIIFDNCELNCDDMSLMVKDTNIINQKYFNYYFLHILSPHLITTTIGKSKKIDINTLLTNEISIPSIMNQNKIVSFYDINYSLINQIKKQIETVNILKYNYIETICNNYPMIKIKDLCDVDVKPINCNITSDIDSKGHINTILSLCVQRNSKSAGNTFYYETKTNNIVATQQIDPKGHINTNVFYLNNIKNTTVELLYILLKHNETNLNKLASITNTINLSRSNLENFEIKNIPLDIQHKVVYKINEYDNMIKSYLKNIDNLINTNIFN